MTSAAASRRDDFARGGLPAAAWPVFLPVFFASGFAALLYQMVWQRLLTFWSGADLYAVTLIVGVYMAGLGFGSLAGGHLADRLRTGAEVPAFALAEAAVAAFALLSRTLIYDTLFAAAGRRPTAAGCDRGRAVPVPAVAHVLHGTVAALCVARIVTDRPEISAERIGGLYGWNTLGAATGALASMWIVVRLLGFATAIQVGAAINGACALGALAVAVLGRRHAVGRQQARAAGEPAAPARPRRCRSWSAGCPSARGSPCTRSPASSRSRWSCCGSGCSGSS